MEIRKEQIHIRATKKEKSQWPRVAKKAKKFKQSIIQHVLEASRKL